MWGTTSGSKRRAAPVATAASGMKTALVRQVNVTTSHLYSIRLVGEHEASVDGGRDVVGMSLDGIGVPSSHSSSPSRSARAAAKARPATMAAEEEPSPRP